MTHRQLVKYAATCIIDALGLQSEPGYLTELLLDAIKEKDITGYYGKKQQRLEDYLRKFNGGKP